MEYTTIQYVMEQLMKANVNPFHVEKVQKYLTNTEFKVYCLYFDSNTYNQFTSIN